ARSAFPPFPWGRLAAPTAPPRSGRPRQALDVGEVGTEAELLGGVGGGHVADLAEHGALGRPRTGEEPEALGSRSRNSDRGRPGHTCCEGALGCGTPPRACATIRSPSCPTACAGSCGWCPSPRAPAGPRSTEDREWRPLPTPRPCRGTPARHRRGA